MQRDDNRKQKYELLWTSRDVTAICAFRFVIFITSRDPAWETGPKREAKATTRRYPPFPSGECRMHRIRFTNFNKKSQKSDFSDFSLCAT